MLLLCGASVALLGFQGEKRVYTFVLMLLMLLNVIGELYQSLFFQKNRLDLSGSALFYRTFWSLLLFCAVFLATKNLLLSVLLTWLMISALGLNGAAISLGLTHAVILTAYVLVVKAELSKYPQND